MLGKALAHLKREEVLIFTKATFRFGSGPNDVGSSRFHLIQSLDRSLKRLGGRREWAWLLCALLFWLTAYSASR
jgi:aryl-alcohol dehydrogenase-like predicted oxidoreductase